MEAMCLPTGELFKVTRVQLGDSSDCVAVSVTVQSKVRPEMYLIAVSRCFSESHNLFLVFPVSHRMGFLLNQNGHLHSHGHAHAHGHSHGSAAASSSQSAGSGQHQGSLAVRAAFIHALGDLVQSVGVLIAAYIVRFKVHATVNN